ncbi:hypothetical protein [Amycolatopsis sp. NPDC004378]
MPATLIEQPLGLSCLFSKGARLTIEVGEAAEVNPTLSRELLMGLINRVHPHGRIDAAHTVGVYMSALRELVMWLANAGMTGSATQLSRPRLAEFWMGCENRNYEQMTRAMLRAAHEQQVLTLTPETWGLVQGRAFKPQRRADRSTLVPYSEGEWARLREACRGEIKQAFAAHRRALEAAARGQDPKTGGWTPDNIRWLLRELGPVGCSGVADYMGVSKHTVQWGWGGVTEAQHELYPRAQLTLAYQLLFGIYSGIVPDGIAELGLDDVDWAGDATALLTYVKGRTSTESLNLPRRAVRLLEQWLEHSALTRRFAPAELHNHLWLRHSPGRWGPWADGTVDWATTYKWLDHHQLTGEDGARLRLHRHRIRTTFESLRDRSSWYGKGRALIDPNHSPRVEGDNYLTATTPAQHDAVTGIIEAAQNDLLRKSQPAMVLTSDQTADLAAQFPDLVKKLALDDAALTELISGQRDVFLASCSDQLAGQWGPAGKPCPARPWVCLLCPLAIFAPRHASNLLRMKAFFGRQWRQMTAEHFMAVFGPYATRIDEVLAALNTHDKTLIARASREVADTDTELPLHPEERTA